MAVNLRLDEYYEQWNYWSKVTALGICILLFISESSSGTFFFFLKNVFYVFPCIICCPFLLCLILSWNSGTSVGGQEEDELQCWTPTGPGPPEIEYILRRISWKLYKVITWFPWLIDYNLDRTFFAATHNSPHACPRKAGRGTWGSPPGRRTPSCPSAVCPTGSSRCWW